VIAAPVLALSTLNCTLATATSSVALAVMVKAPLSVAFAAGAVIETVGGVVSADVEKVMSPLLALALLASVERTRKWYGVPFVKPVRATWWLVTMLLLTGVELPYELVVP
jgi:hypothetical protein